MTHDQELNALRAEWRGTIKDIDGHIRRLDAGLAIDMLERHSGEAAQRWRLMLVAWRDELMDLSRDYATAVTRLPVDLPSAPPAPAVVKEAALPWM